MFDLPPGRIERYVERLDATLALCAVEPHAEASQIDWEHVLEQLERGDLGELGHTLAQLAQLRDTGQPLEWPRADVDVLLEHLEARLHCAEWLDLLIARGADALAIAYARDALLAQQTRAAATPAPLRLSIGHVRGQLQTLQQQEASGMTKLLENIELLQASRAFLTALEPTRLRLYNTTPDEVAATLAQVDQQLLVYQNYLDDELFSDAAVAAQLQDSYGAGYDQRQSKPSRATKWASASSAPAAAAPAAPAVPAAPAADRERPPWHRDAPDCHCSACSGPWPPPAAPAEVDAEQPVERSAQLKAEQAAHLGTLVAEQNAHKRAQAVAELEMLAALAAAQPAALQPSVAALQAALSKHSAWAAPQLQEGGRWRASDLAQCWAWLGDRIFARLLEWQQEGCPCSVHDTTCRAPSIGQLLQHTESAAVLKSTARLGKVKQHTESMSALKRTFLFGKDKLEVAYLVYWHSAQLPGAPITNFQDWLGRALGNLVEPYKKSGAEARLVAELYADLFYLLEASKSSAADPPQRFWPFAPTEAD